MTVAAAARSLLVLAFGVLTAASLAQAAPGAKGLKTADVMLPDALPAVTEAERALTSVASAPGAPAVVLLKGEQYEWTENFVRLSILRRVKILTDAGAADHGDTSMTYYGEWRVGTARARVLLPDGTEVDASSNIHFATARDPDITTITVTFPQVRAGAILDFAVDANANHTGLEEWTAQESIPVREARFVLLPLPEVRYRTATANVAAASMQRHDLRRGMQDVFAWVFRDLAPIPDLPNMQPAGDVAAKLILIPESYRIGGVNLPLATDWKTWAKDEGRSWDTWFKKGTKECAALAAHVTQGAATPRDKAEAIRKALRDRMTRAWNHTWPTGDTPDRSLAQGKGNSADIAGVAIAMLRASGVPAVPASYRQRGSGTLPLDVPAPNLLNDVLVVIPGAGDGGQPLRACFWADVPVGTLPLDALGIHAVTLGKDTAGPELIPDLPPERNGWDRTVRLALALDGTVTGEAELTARGSTAQRWRAMLQKQTADERKVAIEAHVRRYMPSAVVSNWRVDGLDVPTADMVVTVAWEAAGLAQRAGGRMLLNPFVFQRVEASDWSAETRDQNVWLGRPSQSFDSVTIEMPQGIASVQLPAPADLTADKVGAYVSAYSGKDMALFATRKERFDQTLFPAASWGPLREWFHDMAMSDDQSIVFTLAEADP